jgi:hypothetical protein
MEYEPDDSGVATAIEKIIDLNQSICQFWTRQASGWAPKDAAELLEASRMDRLVSLSHSLRLWMAPCPDEDREGRLILAWANLGILVEGTMTWFLCVWENSYSQTPMQTKSGFNLKPNRLRFEELCRFFREHIWVASQVAEWDDWLSMVRDRRNAVHAFNHREMGDWDEFEQSIVRYADFVAELDSRVPYPDISCYG